MHKFIKNKNFVFLSISIILLIASLILSVIAITRSTPQLKGVKSATVMYMLSLLKSENTFAVKLNVITASIGSIIIIIASSLLLIYVIFLTYSYGKNQVALTKFKTIVIAIALTFIVIVAILAMIAAKNITNLDWITSHS